MDRAGLGTGTLGIVLAGGRGSRLGLEVPKAMARVGGQTLLERAIATLVGCDAVVVVAPRDLGIEVPVSTGRGQELRKAHDVGEGPLGGVTAALGVARCERAVLLGVDFPLMRYEMIDALLVRLAYAGAGAAAPPAVVPAPDGVLQPLAAVFAWSALEALAEAHGRGERSIVAAVENLGPRVLDEQALANLPGGLENFLNLNRPEDLTRAERLLNARTAAL
jgi:molybdopterin-guanine dinucleotide biosynthesis protein A